MADPAVDELVHLHRLWSDANVTGDMTFFDEHMHGDVVLFSGDGGVHRGLREARSEWAFVQEEFGYRGIDMTTSDVDVRVHGDGGWVLYEFRLRFEMSGEDHEIRGRGTELYERRDGRWRMAAGHWSWRQ